MAQPNLTRRERGALAWDFQERLWAPGNGLTGPQHAVAAYLAFQTMNADVARRRGGAWFEADQDDIAAATGYRRTAVIAALKYLKTNGWIDVRKVYFEGERRPNLYKILGTANLQPKSAKRTNEPSTYVRDSTLDHVRETDSNYVVREKGVSERPQAANARPTKVQTQTAPPEPPALGADGTNAETETAWLDAAESESRDARYSQPLTYAADLAEQVRLIRKGKFGDKHARARAIVQEQLAAMREETA